MNIHIVFTGGTIGSLQSSEGIISTKESAASLLLDMYNENYGSDCGFTVSSPYYILSENLSADNILSLISEINNIKKRNDLSGIIITHGTDTLQYSAAILGYVFGAAGIPILLVSSDYVLTDGRANGLINFKYAVEFIKGGYGTGVFVSYRNADGISVIHRATRLDRPHAFSADITSICGKYYGRFDNYKYIQCDDCITTGMQSMFDNTDNIALNGISEEITGIIPYVGMKYPEITGNTAAVLHDSYHSGTICINSEFEKFVKSAMDKNVPVYLMGLCAGEASYETVCRYSDYGIKILPPSAFISQYCKLWLAVSNGLNIDEIMGISVAYDHLH